MRQSLKSVTIFMISMGFILITAAIAVAAEASPDNIISNKALIVACSIIGAAIVMGFGTLGPALGMGGATSGALGAVGRNPDAHGKIMLTMLVGLAMIESIAIYALVIALVIIYANPLLKFMGV
jgi:F-type H+-transporting ATPase subunit c